MGIGYWDSEESWRHGSDGNTAALENSHRHGARTLRDRDKFHIESKQ